MYGEGTLQVPWSLAYFHPQMVYASQRGTSMQKKKARQQVGILYQNSTPLQILHHVLLQLVSRARGLYFSLFPQIKKNMAGSQDYILQLYLAYICSHLEYAIYVPLHYCKIVTKKRLFLSLNKAS